LKPATYTPTVRESGSTKRKTATAARQNLSIGLNAPGGTTGTSGGLNL